MTMTSIQAPGAPTPVDPNFTHNAPPPARQRGQSVGPDAGEGAILFLGDTARGTVPVLALPKKMDADVMVLLLYAVQKKQGQDQIETAEERIADSKEARQKKHDELMEKLKEIKEKQSEGDTAAKVGLAFGWVGVGLAWIVVALAAVFSGGAAAAPLIVAAVALTAFMLCQQTGATDKAIEAMDMNDQEAMGFQIGLAAFMLVLTIALTIVSCGAAAGAAASSAGTVASAGTQTGTAAAQTGTAAAQTGTAAAQTGTAAAQTGTAAAQTGTAAAQTGTAATQTGTAATQTATTATQTATTATQTGTTATQTGTTATQTGTTATQTGTTATQTTSTGTQTGSNVAQTAESGAKLVRIANRVRAAAQVSQGVTQAGGSSAQVATTTYTYEATMARADVQDEQAQLARLQDMTYDQLRRIRKLIEQLQDAGMIVVATIADSRDTAMQIRQTI